MFAIVYRISSSNCWGFSTNALKRAIIACALLLVGTFAVQAYHSSDTYYDLVRPNGKPRSDAIFDADLNFCYRQTGDSRYGLGDSPAFKQCMLGRKWRWESVSALYKAECQVLCNAARTPDLRHDPETEMPAKLRVAHPEEWPPEPIRRLLIAHPAGGGENECAGGVAVVRDAMGQPGVGRQTCG